MHYQIELQSLSNPVVRIPWATGIDHLDADADIWLYHIPLSARNPISEFIITPFDMLVWKDLWSIRMINQDKEGVLARLATFLSDRNINIVSMSSSTTDRGFDHASRLVVDCSGYKSEIDGDHDYRGPRPSAKLTRLQRELELEFIQDLRFLDHSTPAVSIYRNLALWRLHKEIMGLAMKPRGTRLSISQGSVDIPASELRRTSAAYSHEFNISQSSLAAPSALIATNLFSDVMQISTFFENSGIVVFALSVDNQPGAIAAVATSLRANSFNILGDRAWTSSQERTSILIVVQDRSIAALPASDTSVLERLTSLVFSSELVQEYNPAIQLVEL